MACAHRVLPVGGLIDEVHSNCQIRPTLENIMKKQHFLATTLSAGRCMAAFAGPDQVIEKARADQAAVAAQATTTRVDSATGNRVNCARTLQLLPLDHGPRAQTTPGENRMRRARYEAQVSMHRPCAVNACPYIGA